MTVKIRMSNHSACKRLLLRAIYPAFRVLFPNQVIRADNLARAMDEVALRRTGERGEFVFENLDIRAMVESLRPCA